LAAPGTSAWAFVSLEETVELAAVGLAGGGAAALAADATAYVDVCIAAAIALEVGLARTGGLQPDRLTGDVAIDGRRVQLTHRVGFDVDVAAISQVLGMGPAAPEAAQQRGEANEASEITVSDGWAGTQ
jgi:hypothetical protein